ncbi:MAG TPA: hypothetical protein VIO11_06020 [Candidatus Methanoperedens sp.]
MRRNKDINNLLKQLEEIFNDLLEEIDYQQNRQIFIDISLNVHPFSFINFDQSSMLKAPVDIIETEKKVQVMVGLQGMDKETIKFLCSGSVLEITACKAGENLKETIELPAKVNKTGMKVTYENGILEVTFNKSRRARHNN